MRARYIFGMLPFLLLAVLLTVGCQSGNESPVVPDGQTTDLSPGKTAVVSTNNNSVMWGYWRCFFDPESGSIEAVPLRGVQFSANVNTFLEPGGHPGPNLGIAIDADDSDFTNNIFAVDVTLNHPLPFEMYSGFDVRGIFMHNGSASCKSDPGLYYAAIGSDTDAVLLNADGWTRWWNPAEFTDTGVLGYTQGALASFFGHPSATLNAYKIFADDLDLQQDFREFITDENNFPNRCWFAAGSSNSRRYMIQFPPGALEYDYCVYASWVETDPANSGHEDQYEPGDFPPDANAPEAFFLASDTSDSTAYYNGPGDTGGSVHVSLEVFDWQGYLSNPMLNINDQIAEIRVESLSTLINETDNTYIINDPATIASISDKGSDVSSVYDFDITNLNLTTTGVEELFISVLNTDPDSYDSGYGADYPTDAFLAAYTFGSVEIGGGNPCPTPVITAMDPDFILSGIPTLDDAEITGENFEYGPNFEVKLVFDTYEIVGTDVSNLTSTSFTADFDMGGAPIEVYDVVVMNDCGVEGIGEDLFSVVGCVPVTITSIEPDCLHTGSYIENVQVVGEDFYLGPHLAVKITDGNNEISATDIEWVNGTLLTCTFSFGSLPAGTYDVEITQGCNPLYKDTIPNGFNVYDDNTGNSPYYEVGYDSTYDIRDHTGATEVSLTDDDDTDPIAFFDFDYYGVIYDYFKIGSNGGIYLTDDPADTTYAGSIFDDCGDDVNFIIPLGEDYDPPDSPNGHIRYEIQGSSPDRTLTVQWDAIQCYPGDSEPGVGEHTFSVTLFETSNLCLFQYEDPDLTNSGSSTFGDPFIAYCSFEDDDYYPESTPLFCAADEWPADCIQFRAYEVDFPNATMIPPPACTYTHSEQSYDSAYECSAGAHVITHGELNEYSTWDAWDEGCTDPISLGFTYDFCDMHYTTCIINVNGSVTLGSVEEQAGRYGLSSSEDPDMDIISAQSDDLDNEDPDVENAPVGEIKYETRTVNGYECFIVEWEGVPSYYQDGSSNSFQIILVNDPAESTCDNAYIQWQELYDTSYNDTVINYNVDELYVLYENTGQPVPGGVNIYPQ